MAREEKFPGNVGIITGWGRHRYASKNSIFCFLPCNMLLCNYSVTGKSTVKEEVISVLSRIGAPFYFPT